MQAGSLRELHTFQHHLSITKTPDLPSTGVTCCTFKYMVTNFNNVQVNQSFLLDIHLCYEYNKGHHESSFAALSENKTLQQIKKTLKAFVCSSRKSQEKQV